MFPVVLFVLSGFAAICSAEEVGALSLLDGRIVGGSDATIYDFPHQVSLRYDGDRHRCGGSIYLENIIITSSYCVKYKYDVIVVVGSTFLSDRKIEIPVKKIITHPKFTTSNPDYDVAVLVLSEPLQFGPGVQPIALAKERPPGGTIGTIIGWGSLEYLGVNSDQLQKVDVNVLSKAECLKVYTIFISGKNICTYSTGKDACLADRGGPLIVNNKLLGIISWGRDCAVEDYPRVHASVPDLYSWIMETIEQNTA